MARMAAGDKIGAYDEHITVFAGSMSGPPPADTRQRREMMARRASGQMDVLIEFVTKYACNLFPAELTQPSLLARVKEQVVELSQYGAAAAAFLAAGHGVIDVAAMLGLRVDAHPGSTAGGTDGLHFCMPGPLDYALDIVLARVGSAFDRGGAEIDGGLE